MLALLTATGCSTPWDEIAIAEGEGVLRIVVTEAGEEVPARVELRDPAGTTLVPEAGIVVGGDCRPRTTRLTADRARDLLQPGLFNAMADAEQFYVDRRLQVALPAGTYRLTGTRGTEYRPVEVAAHVTAGEVAVVRLQLERWADAGADGWMSADGHTHIPRIDAEDDERIAAWMAAEDLDVVHLLQWGNRRGFLSAPQYAFGSAGTHRSRGVTLVPGQEAPRTPVFGHAMLLAAAEPVHRSDDYLAYAEALSTGQRTGGLAGIGHSGEWGGEWGVPLLAAHDALDFLEVFTYRTPDYDLWYEALNAGHRLAPTAGSDYPCGDAGGPPGAQRMYARVGQDRSLEGWIAAVRAGRTFVTNGTLLDLEVDGVGMGNELRVPGPGTVRVSGAALWDPAQEHVRALDLVVDGEVAQVFREPTAPGEIRFQGAPLAVEASSWVAIRTFGSRRGARAPWHNAFAHSAPVWLRLATDGGVAAGPGARRQREAWRERLRELGRRVADAEALVDLAGGGADALSPEELLQERFTILREVQEAVRRLGSR